MLRFATLILILYSSIVFPASWADNRLPPFKIPTQDMPTQGADPVAFPAVSSPMLANQNYFDLEKQRIIRWNDQTKYIMVYISDGSHLPGWNPEHVNAVKAAFSEWEQALNPRFRFIYMPDERGSDIKVIWASRAGDGEGDEVAGLNEVRTWGKFISKNDIKLSLMHPNGQIYPPPAIFSTTLHEAGHALGLHAHSENKNDIMYAKSQVKDWNEVLHLSERDINTMKMVYAAKPDYTNPEGYHLSNFDAFKKTQKGHRLSILWVMMPGVPVPVPIPLPF